MGWSGDYIAVDWGTTNRRAYRIDTDGAVTGSFADERGMLSVPQGGFEAAAAEIRTQLGALPMLLAGMVGADRGWREAPYVACPAGAPELAAAVLWIEPGRTGIVPGVCQRAPAADVMRGEEVQVLGAVAAGMVPGDALICHPGTHAKWIRMIEGHIAAFRTMMTGELFALLKTHSILAGQLQDEVTPGAAFRRGVAAGLEGAGPVESLFALRARRLVGEGRDDAASYASGLMIGGDVRAGLSLHDGGAIALVGRPDLCALYRVALAEGGHAATAHDGAAAFLAGMRLLTERL